MPGLLLYSPVTRSFTRRYLSHHGLITGAERFEAMGESYTRPGDHHGGCNSSRARAAHSALSAAEFGARCPEFGEQAFGSRCHWAGSGWARPAAVERIHLTFALYARERSQREGGRELREQSTFVAARETVGGTETELLLPNLLPNGVALAAMRRDEERFRTPKTETIRHFVGLFGMRRDGRDQISRPVP